MKIKPVPDEYKYAVAVREDTCLWLVLWVRRSPKGEFFVLRTMGDRDWNPHTSYHLDGTLHMKSHDRKVLTPQKRQPLTGPSIQTQAPPRKHGTRKPSTHLASARRARYAAEAARPASGKAARKFGRQMKKVQSVIGDHQDTVIAREAARELGIGAHLAGENAFTYGLLHEQERHQAERLQGRARTVWKKASRPRHRTWMR